MGWHECLKCMSDKWTTHRGDLGCDMCNPAIEGIIKEEVKEFFERNINEKIVIGVAVR